MNLSFKKLTTNKNLLIGVVLLAAFLRFINIDSNPKAMYGDELTLVYDAYSLSLTGKDQKGEGFPLVFQLGGSRPPVYVYATIPFARLLGPTELAARFVSVLSGIGIVLLLYLIVKVLSEEKTALLAALLGAISPWGISISRGGFEANLALFLALLGIFSLFKSFEKPRWLYLSAFFFALSMQTYATYRLTLPLTISIFVLLYFQEFKKMFQYFTKIIISSLVILIVSIFLSLYLMASIGNRDRFSEINIFQNSEKGVVSIFIRNYLDSFSPSFLIVSGDGNPRHNPSEIGEFYFITPLLIVFALLTILRSNPKLAWALIGWILLSPVATSLVGGAHALRSSFMLPPILVLSAYGISKIWQLKAPIIRITLILIIFLSTFYQFAQFSKRVYISAPEKFEEFWSYSAKVAAQIAAEKRDSFDYIILSNDIANMEYAYPTYNKLNPRLVMAQNANRTTFNSYQFFNYGNVYIGSLPKGQLVSFWETLPGSSLYIGPKEDLNGIDPPKKTNISELSPNLILIEKEE